MSTEHSLPSQRTLRLRFGVWTALMLAMLAVFAFIVTPRLNIETDILALLPSTHDANVDDAIDHLTNTLAQRQLILVGDQDLATAKHAAIAFADALSASKQFKNVTLKVSGDLNAVLASYQAYWPMLLADRDRERLQQGDSDALYRDALRAAYTPSGMMRVVPLAQDPLGLRNNFLQQQLPTIGNARLDDSMLIATANDRYYVLITAETDGSVFSADAQDRMLPAIDAATDAAQRAMHGNGEIVISGALQHAAAATRQAKNEINTFGSIETVAVLALLFYVFGRLRPLILGAMVLGLSAAASITASHFIFGQLHILALVFGASLIGVVIDYSMHFFADQFRTTEWTPADAVAHVGPAIVLGMFTTLVGYAGLVLMPFPGLRQIAAFCMVGILVGCGSVLFLYPQLMGARRKPLPLRGPHLAAKLDRYLLAWQWTTPKIGVLVGLIVVALLGALRVQSQDDIRSLQSSPPQLVRNEQRVQEILGGGIETRFYLVQADDEESLLQREEQLRARLDELVANKSLGAYFALTRALPSQQRQAADHELLATRVYADNGPFAKIESQLGFDAEHVKARRDDFVGARKPLTLATWLENSASGPYRYLWLGKSGSQFASVVTLSGIHDIDKLGALTGAVAGVKFIDRPHEVSQVMSRYRSVTAWLLVVANLTAFAVLCWRFGWRDATRLALPSVAACVATLGVFGWLGVGINLFNVFALLLVFALGIDYGIFLMHGRTARVTAILSVTLSACTTLIGFGMLSFSATPFIRSIGSTLLLGIVCSWIFVMLSCMTQWRPRALGETND